MRKSKDLYDGSPESYQDWLILVNQSYNKGKSEERERWTNAVKKLIEDVESSCYIIQNDSLTLNEIKILIKEHLVAPKVIPQNEIGEPQKRDARKAVGRDLAQGNAEELSGASFISQKEVQTIGAMVQAIDTIEKDVCKCGHLESEHFISKLCMACTYNKKTGICERFVRKNEETK